MSESKASEVKRIWSQGHGKYALYKNGKFIGFEVRNKYFTVEYKD